MQTHSFRSQVALALLAFLVGVSVARASSANFVLSGQGIDLGKGKEVVEKGKSLIQYDARIGVGKPFTLVAQGMAYGRGDLKGSPTRPDEGAWTFDEKVLQKVAPGKEADKTVVPITLRSAVAGPTRVRFTGKVLGYERTFEVRIEVMPVKLGK